MNIIYKFLCHHQSTQFDFRSFAFFVLPQEQKYSVFIYKSSNLFLTDFEEKIRYRRCFDIRSSVCLRIYTRYCHCQGLRTTFRFLFKNQETSPSSLKIRATLDSCLLKHFVADWNIIQTSGYSCYTFIGQGRLRHFKFKPSSRSFCQPSKGT